MRTRVSEASPPSPTRPASTQPFKALLEEARRAPATPPGLVRKTSGVSAQSVKELQPVTTKAAPRASATSRAPAARAADRAAPATSRAQPNASAVTQAVARGRVEAEAGRLIAARAHHVATAETSSAVRAELNGTADERASTRHVELIVKELLAEFEPRPAGSPQRAANALQPVSSANEVPFSPSAPVATGAPAPRPTPEVRASQAAALIERIDVFVKSQRPALALTLNNSLGARVEIEKLGPGRIALRLVGREGPPDADTVSRLREELEARGLKVGALSVG